MGFPLPAQFEFGQFGGSAMATSSWAGVHARPVKPVPGAWRRGDARRAGRGRPRSVIPSPLPRGPGPLPARGYELERRRVQAVAQAGRRRAVGKHVTEVAVTPSAADLGTDHPGTRVADGSDVVGIERLEEAGPARTRLELRLRPEERQAAQPARVRARFFLVQQGAAEGPLGAVVQQDPTLLRGQRLGEAGPLGRAEWTEVVAGSRALRGRVRRVVLHAPESLLIGAEAQEPP